MLAGAHDDARRWLPDNNDARVRFLTALEAGAPFPDPAGLGPLETAIVTGLTAEAPPTEDAAAIADRIDAGAVGEALLRTLALLAPGVEIDPGDLSAALFLLRRAGQADTARQVAAETLLLLPPA